MNPNLLSDRKNTLEHPLPWKQLVLKDKPGYEFQACSSNTNQGRKCGKKLVGNTCPKCDAVDTYETKLFSKVMITSYDFYIQIVHNQVLISDFENVCIEVTVFQQALLQVLNCELDDDIDKASQKVNYSCKREITFSLSGYLFTICDDHQREKRSQWEC